MSNRIDLLTGIPSRTAFQDCIADWVENSQQFALILIDIDRFIFFNDRYGHHKGDDLLQQLANLIRQQVPAEAQVFRTGGDEFVVLLLNTPLSSAIALADQIRIAIAQHCCNLPVQQLRLAADDSYQEFQVLPTASCSVGMYPENGQDWISLMQALDEAMYQQSKQFGGNRVAVLGAKEREYDES